MTLGSLAGQLRNLGSLVGDSRRDTRPVEPGCAFHNLVEIEICRVSLSDGGVCAVVDDLAGTHRCACLAVIETYTVTAANDIVILHAITAQSVDCYLTNLVLRQFGDEVSLVAVVGAGDSYVRLTTARDDAEVVGLNETVLSFRTEAKHNLA